MGDLVDGINFTKLIHFIVLLKSGLKHPFKLNPCERTVEDEDKLFHFSLISLSIVSTGSSHVQMRSYFGW